MYLFAFVLVSCHFKWKLFGANRPSFILKNNTRKKIRKTKQFCCRCYFEHITVFK